MGTTTSSGNGKKNNEAKMQYKKVSFDINEIAPDAPEAEWKISIPRGKCKVQPTKEEKLPMIIVPIRLESTDEEGVTYEKALGTELSVFLVFGGKTPRGERMAKLRIREICEAADIDLDIIPKEIDDPESDLDPFIRKLEGKKFTAWTKHQVRKDTGETTTEVSFRDPKKMLTKSDEDDDSDTDVDDDEGGGGDSDSDDGKPQRGARKKSPAKKKTASKSKS